MPPIPAHPYSGHLPQASSSAGSLRLPPDLGHRSRSNTTSSLSRDTSPVPHGLPFVGSSHASSRFQNSAAPGPSGLSGSSSGSSTGPFHASHDPSIMSATAPFSAMSWQSNNSIAAQQHATSRSLSSSQVINTTHGGAGGGPGGPAWVPPTSSRSIHDNMHHHHQPPQPTFHRNELPRSGSFDTGSTLWANAHHEPRSRHRDGVIGGHAGLGSASSFDASRPLHSQQQRPSAPVHSMSYQHPNQHSHHASQPQLQNLSTAAAPPTSHSQPYNQRHRHHDSTTTTHTTASSSENTTPTHHPTGIKKYILAESEHSKDGGDTLDLSRRGIRTVDADDVTLLRSGVGRDKAGVWRLALSYNRLTHRSFDPSFKSLIRLRYLNLKGNRLGSIPQVVSQEYLVSAMKTCLTTIHCSFSNFHPWKSSM